MCQPRSDSPPHPQNRPQSRLYLSPRLDRWENVKGRIASGPNKSVSPSLSLTPNLWMAVFLVNSMSVTPPPPNRGSLSTLPLGRLHRQPRRQLNSEVKLSRKMVITRRKEERERATTECLVSSPPHHQINRRNDCVYYC